MSCPRCQSETKYLRTEYEGREDGELVWTVYHCQRCAFTWRDSEPAASIDYAVRDAWFRVDADQLDQYPQNIPPARVKKP